MFLHAVCNAFGEKVKEDCLKQFEAVDSWEGFLTPPFDGLYFKVPNGRLFNALLVQTFALILVRIEILNPVPYPLVNF